ncbi:MAG: methionyl-tRNA formyltransferase [Elusimicrobia bacterium]|nr:methionyl-tRNA formyltransferase [Elusimicrobiota bacterium]
MSKLRIVFLGTPDIACGFLSRMAEDGCHIAGVISRPDRPRGRGLKLCCPPVENKARELRFKTFQPHSDEEFAGTLSELQPDLGVVVAYGRLIKKEALAQARLGFINVHFSLLPKYRGAAPVQWALIKGETVTGVTVFWLDEGMDTGPVFAAREVPILPADDALSMFEKTAAAGTDLLAGCLKRIAAGELIKTPQTGPATPAPRIKFEHTRLDFSGPAGAAVNLVRGLSCGPRARFDAVINGKKTTIQVLKASLPALALRQTSLPASAPDGPAGPAGSRAGAITAIERGKGFFVKCSDSNLIIEEVQPEGKKPMKAVDFLNGARLKIGDRVEGERKGIG